MSADRWVPPTLHQIMAVAKAIHRTEPDDRLSEWSELRQHDLDVLRSRAEAVIRAMIAAAPAAPAAEPVALTDKQREAARDALATALGDAYDCTRVWSAWSYGTMGPDDFVQVVEQDDRLEEILDAVLTVVSAPGAAPAADSPAPLTMLTDEQIEAAMNPCDDSDMGRHLRREFIASFKRVNARLHGIGSKP